jgi:hypothetical protein
MIVATVNAQVTINVSDIPMSNGSVVHYAGTEDYVAVNVGPSGANQTWDFSAMSTNTTWEMEWMDPSETPNGNQFPSANHSSERNDLPDFYSYFQSNSNNFLLIGNDADGSITHTTYSVTPDNFPLSYNGQWMSVSETLFDTPGFSQVDTTEGWVDGWGTLVDGNGSHNCLRAKIHNQYTILMNSVPIESFSFWQYYWYVPGGAGFVSINSQVDEPNPNFTQGIFSWMTEVSTGIEASAPGMALPTQITLEPAFPNPFNPETYLNFDLPTAGSVTLAIYDPQGRRVSTLQNGWMNAGRYQAHFDASHLPSGVYLARLTTADFSRTEKLNLLK